ncbi:sigma-E factor negative regulatory protein [Alkalimarinus coralli]|uniref:sigma-E factor negative regulatory protein n=1 Tax=Alkalimarinus coralli TaxID=2935863 RepID=UPI00202AE52D|nr:sigma-E factor negative regulatory protein [Alkalimarinus coralli]
MKESISALLDNEADELELRRVLNHSDDSAMRSVWARYSKVSDLLSSGQSTYNQHAVDSTNSFLDIDISADISKSIENIDHNERVYEPVAMAATEHTTPSANKMDAGFFSRVAIAAAVILSISLVFKPFDGGFGGSAGVDDALQTASVDAGSSGFTVEKNTAIDVLQNSLPAASDGESVEGVQVVERPFTPEHARRLNQYLLRHAENSVTGGRSGLMPLARVASLTITEN